jgi:MraZ protein
MAVFVGEFDQTIDPKHRLAIPAALREQVDPGEDGTDYYLVLGPDKHLWLYPDLYYQKLLRPLQRSPFPSRDAQKLALLFALARVVKPDGQGRIVLPEKSMQRAEISEKLTLVGKGDHIELWPSEQWEQFVEQALPRYGEDLLDAGDGLDPAAPHAK